MTFYIALGPQGQSNSVINDDNQVLDALGIESGFPQTHYSAALCLELKRADYSKKPVEGMAGCHKTRYIITDNTKAE